MEVFIGKSSINGSFSIAMVNNHRVSKHPARYSLAQIDARANINKTHDGQQNRQVHNPREQPVNKLFGVSMATCLAETTYFTPFGRIAYALEGFLHL